MAAAAWKVGGEVALVPSTRLIPVALSHGVPCSISTSQEDWHQARVTQSPVPVTDGLRLLFIVA